MRFRKYIAALLCLGCLLGLGACGSEEAPAVQPTDPYAGMLQVPSGYGTQIWVKEYDDVAPSSWDPELFSGTGLSLSYDGDDAVVTRGVDVSEHQAEIDWQAVADAGIDFAIIRAGYRGYSEGGLYEDAYFRQNLTGARAVGLQVGVYFFSQATTAAEAVEEAEYLLELLDGAELDLPVMFDWETIDGDEARTDDVTGDQLTELAVAFCERIREAGYDAGIYAYRYLAYFYYDLSQLTGYELWIGAVGDQPDFYYEYDIWQYSVSGAVDGIEGEVDLDLRLIPSYGSSSGASESSDEDAGVTADASSEADTVSESETVASSGQSDA